MEYTRNLSMLEFNNALNLMSIPHKTTAAQKIMVAKLQEKFTAQFKDVIETYTKAQKEHKENKPQSAFKFPEAEKKKPIEFSKEELRCIGECFVDVLSGDSSNGETAIQIWSICDSKTFILQRFLEKHSKLSELKPLEDEFLDEEDGDLIPEGEPEKFDDNTTNKEIRK